MNNLTFRPIKNEDEDVLKQWLASDPQSKKFIVEYGDVPAWLKLLRDDERLGFILRSDDIDVGFIDLEKNEHIGYFTFFVAPQFRGLGLGVKLLNGMELLLRQFNITVAEGYFEPENIASRNTLARAGFDLADEVDKDGMVRASKTILQD